MREHGTLVKWNDDRGFGFIRPARGHEDIFVHISAFPKDGRPPRTNELISYETQTGPNGKLRGVRVMQSTSLRAAPHRVDRPPASSLRWWIAGVAMVLFAVGAVAFLGYSRLVDRVSSGESITPAAAPQPQPAHLIEASSFACDGRIYCSQMRSCEEAKYFLHHCPNVKMDGDHDGIPCEDQWCG
ncbi:MAG: excalibur calcium-binding domain-containing protein [Proteobacteria bacterium]|nr:excalibur calcium-binding domain-containing protein [Pseudomonadota bacterium]